VFLDYPPAVRARHLGVEAGLALKAEGLGLEVQGRVIVLEAQGVVDLGQESLIQVADLLVVV
jgi:hypothetical protein